MGWVGVKAPNYRDALQLPGCRELIGTPFKAKLDSDPRNVLLVIELERLVPEPRAFLSGRTIALAVYLRNYQNRSGIITSHSKEYLETRGGGVFPSRVTEMSADYSFPDGSEEEMPVVNTESAYSAFEIYTHGTVPIEKAVVFCRPNN